ncbi:MAG TPA: hypothetical protein DDY29_16435, partial [Rhodobacteraceae bacterium]|nr:hypothetical protein [Paracoccaceae bacterium]
MTEPGPGTVRSRQVFYVPGYDPVPPRKYREIYRREAAAQAAISGHEIDVAGLPGTAAWTVAATIGGSRTKTRVEVLVWSDIVQASMARGIAATYALMARTLWIYVASGALTRLAGLRIAPVLAALYPVAMLTAQLLAALLAGWAVGALVAIWLPAWAGWTVGLATLGAALRGFRALDHRLYAYYLMQDYAHAAAHGGACPPELAARIAAFGDRIAAALRDGPDEVLVVGHSSGAHIAAMVLAGLMRAGRVPEDGPALSLLTLGHVVPMVSFLPAAADLRRDLAALAAQDRIAWVDVTAPGDGACFALCDPVAVSGVAPAAQRWPLVISAAFSQSLAPATWKRLRRRFFRLHFQYLHAFDRPGAYDYFAITAGPQTLAERFGGRAHSPGRIARPHSPHSGMA